jgi:Zn-finger nucleic acid-binding protein
MPLDGLAVLLAGRYTVPRMASIKCPACDGEMNEIAYEGVMIDLCGECGGGWLDQKEIGAIVDNREKTFSEEEQIDALSERQKNGDREHPVRCPKCGDQMQTFQYAVNSGVFLDRCPNRHGLWLDPGELEQVQIVMEEHSERFDAVAKDENTTPPDVKVCVRDGAELHQIEYEGQLLDLCPQCNGVWCDENEFSKVITSREVVFSREEKKEVEATEEKALPSANEDLAATLPCVVCGETMLQFKWQYASGIIVDRCQRGHGMWLDASEIEAAQIFAENWEREENRLHGQYSGMLNKVREKTSKSWKLDNLKVSRFGPVNRFLQRLSHWGLFD